MPLGFARNAGLITGGGGGFDYSTTGSPTVRTYGLYTTLQYIGSGNFEVLSNGSGPTATTIDILIIAGGAACYPYTGYGSGGGGAGGFRWLQGASAPVGTHYISVGAGTSSSTPGNHSYVPSAFQTGGGSWSPNTGDIYAYGGGTGATYPYAQAAAGGSGGGGAGPWPGVGPGNSPSVSPSQGNSGGTGVQNQWGHQHGAGGGGSGSTGGQNHWSNSYMCSYPYCHGGAGSTVDYVTGSTGSGAGYSGFCGGGTAYATAGYYSSPYPGTFGAFTQGNGTAYSGAGAQNGYTGGSGCVTIRFLTP